MSSSPTDRKWHFLAFLGQEQGLVLATALAKAEEQAVELALGLGPSHRVVAQVQV